MNDLHTVNAIGTLLEELGHEEALRRLRGAASPPETGSRTRVAGSKPGDPLTSTSELPFADQATGALERLVEYLKGEAATCSGHAAEDRMYGDWGHARHYEKRAADFNRWASLVDAVCREPRAQSDRNGDERCPECRSWLGVTTNADGNLICPNCKTTWAPGVGVERSGSANANAQPPGAAD